jgi:hypothetical protein
MNRHFLRPLTILILTCGFFWLAAALILTPAETAFATVGTRTPAPSPTTGPSGPDRYAPVTVNYTAYEWWLIEYEGNEFVCQIVTDHDGLPNANDVYASCGDKVYKLWVERSDPCTAPDPSLCKGYYLQFVSATPAHKEVAVKLPGPSAWITLEECEPGPYGGCLTRPILVLTGAEPLPGESIVEIRGLLAGEPFNCDGDRCLFSLEETDPAGVELQFWVYSSYGDTSAKFTALVRVYTLQAETEESATWYVDVLSTQWAGAPLASCSETWDTFPPVEGLPLWLSTPETSDKLASDIPYTYLAGNLIAQGAVDVSACMDGGLLPDGAASPCGMDAARGAVTDWQNRFDTLIFQVAHGTGVPAQLLKNMFSRESQFWPGVFREGHDVGLGQLTEKGADTTLMWNRPFYDQFCPLVLSQDVCKKGYAKLKPSQQAMLRGALVRSVDATCVDCPLGIDLAEADFSVGVFGQTLLANCEQAGKVVRNITGKSPGKSVAYEDMWRFTLVNYNAGPGCLYDALKLTYTGRKPLDWENLSFALDSVCPGATDYVNDISQ